MTTLLSNASETGSGVDIGGGRYGVFVKGTNFGTVHLEMLHPGDEATWVDVANGSFTADGQAILVLPQGTIRAHVASATAVYVDLVHIGY